MKIDLSQCVIGSPTGNERLPLYRLLTEIFPSDGPLISELIDDEGHFPDWPAYTLWMAGEALGNVSLAPMLVWLAGQPTDLAGIAWVVTREDCRRRGIARRLLRHVLKIVDETALPTVLFTGLPEVYEPFGFEAVGQVYPAAPARRLAFDRPELESRIHHTLTPALLDALARLYADDESNHDGRVVRDRKYWRFYSALFNGNRDVSLLVAERGGEIVGYARIETETDRLLIPECSCRAEEMDVARALFCRVGEIATDAKLETVTLALPGDHLAMRMLRESGVTLDPEPDGAARETFMVRTPGNRPLGPLATLQWPLSDKF